MNVFLPANVHKRDLHQIHMLAWKKGMKSLYYCRSLAIQRADNVSAQAARPAEPAVAIEAVPIAAASTAMDYEECLACQ